MSSYRDRPPQLVYISIPQLVVRREKLGVPAVVDEILHARKEVGVTDCGGVNTTKVHKKHRLLSIFGAKLTGKEQSVRTVLMMQASNCVWMSSFRPSRGFRPA